MKIEELEEFFVSSKENKSSRMTARKMNGKIRLLCRSLDRMSSSEKYSASIGRWVYENTPLLKNDLLRLLSKTFVFPKNALDGLIRMFSNHADRIDMQDVNLIYVLLSKRYQLSEEEILSIRSALFYSLGAALLRENAPSNFPQYYKAYHRIRKVDFSILERRMSPLEQILRCDPSNDYPYLTAATQAMYRDRIKKTAKKRGLSSEELANQIVESCKPNKDHIGFRIVTSPNKNWYPKVLFVLFSFLLCQLLVASRSLLFTLLAAIPLYYFSKDLLDRIVSRCVKPFLLPQLKISRVDLEQKTAVVIASLVSKKAEIDALFEKLDQYRINNASAEDEIVFGLLLDLPEHAEKISEKDRELIEYLKEETERYNGTSNQIFSVLRERSYHKSEERFVGWERKRGAIDQLIRFICGEEVFFGSSLFGCYERLEGTKLLITLDADTRLSINQAKRLIGTALHPLNRPQIVNQNGHFRVERGYGIIQPRIASSLLEPIKTPFGKMQGNGSGRLPYVTAAFDRMQSLFGEGNFCGKGIIDVEAYYKVMKDSLPEQRILSHDFPEGAFLRCGLLSNEFFFDSNPQTLLSFYKRQHRWIRGDVQNIVLFSRFSRKRKWFYLENLIHYFVPIAEFALVFVSCFYDLRYGFAATLLVFLFHLSPLVLTVFERTLSCNDFSVFSRRFATKNRNVFLNALYQGLLSISSIAFEAHYYFDAIIRSLFRLFFSKKKLLEWQAYSPLSSSGGAFFFAPSLVIGIATLFVCNNVPLLVMSLLWCIFPFISYYLSRPYSQKGSWRKQEQDTMLEYAKSEFEFFRTVVNQDTNYLPPDNLQCNLCDRIAMRTSPTNIGLYLASLVAARDLNLIGTEELYRKMKATLNVTETLDRDHGHLYNWYDLKTLGVLGEKFVSTVDSGNYVACLMCVETALREYEKEKTELRHLRESIEREIASINFNYLFCHERGLFYVGVSDGKKDSASCYDLYFSEARITLYLSIALGQISPEAWGRPSRPLLSFRGRVGLGSWSGTTFEAFMPSLFFPTVRNSLEDESLDYALFCQKQYRANISDNESIFGISESGNTQTDAVGNYQYQAYGVPYLSIQPSSDDGKIISPYSSFLMLEREDPEVLKNLKTMEHFGLKGEFGFYEACEFNTNFLDDYQIVKSYMSHHKGMSILALTNALKEGVFRRRFLDFGDNASKIELLAERFPLEESVLRQAPQQVKVKNDVNIRSREVVCSEKDIFSTSVTDGKMTLVASSNGSFFVQRENVRLFSFHPEKNKMLLVANGRKYDLFSQARNPISMSFHEDQIRYRFEFGIGTLTLVLRLIGGCDSVLIDVSGSDFVGEANFEISLNSILSNEKEYESHPAFHNLSLEASFDGCEYLISRRRMEQHWYLSFYSSKLSAVRSGENPKQKSLKSQAMLNESSTLYLSEHCTGVCSFSVLCFFSEHKGMFRREVILDQTDRLLPEKSVRSQEKILRLYQNCCYREELFDLESMILNAIQNKRIFYIGNISESRTRDFLWQYGISGDAPIVSIFVASPKDLDILSDLLSVKKKFSLSHIEMDLVILHEEKGEYFDPIRENISDLIREAGLNYLIGKRAGIHTVKGKKNEEIAFQRLSCICFSFHETAKTLQQLASLPNKVQRCESLSASLKQIGKLEKNAFIVDSSCYRARQPLSQVVSNRTVGFVCDQHSLGFTWYRNAGLCRISKWNNCPERDDGEKVFLLFEDQLYDLIENACQTKYRDHFAVYCGKICGNDYQVIASVVEKISSKFVYVSLSGKLSEKGRLVFSFVPCVGKNADQNMLIEICESYLRFSPCRYGDVPFSGFCMIPDRNINVSAKTDRLLIQFEGQNDNLIFLGGTTSERQFQDQIRRIRDQDLEQMLISEDAFCRSVMPTNFESSLKFWISYQAVHARFYGRTGLYQSSGAYGFRDQLQDCLIFLNYQPNLTRYHLIKAAAHQMENGSVLHWWHPIKSASGSDSGVVTKCSDDYLWLLFCFSEYNRETQDRSILDVKVPFLQDVPLSDQESEKYVIAQKSTSAPFLQHLERAAKLLMKRGLGDHSLPLIGSGDWNDGMNRIDGESVWLGFFAAISLNRCKNFFSDETKSQAKIYLRDLAKGLRESFNGGWYVRIFAKNGQTIGSDISLESECSIDLITQAFSAFYWLDFRRESDCISEDSVRSALLSAYENLVDEKAGTVSLFQLPFVNSIPSPGYIQRYCAGLRENGGQYTHAAVWFALALVNFGCAVGDDDLVNKGIRVCEILNPEKNISVEQYQKYLREPYVLCGDVYTANGFHGHGGWSWYTGAAAWYVRLLDQIEKIKKSH